jgi:hypothetical protein
MAPLCFSAVSGAPLPPRVWVSDAGTTVTAEFVTAGDGKVVLRREDGSLLEVPLQRLSEGDRDWVAEQVRPALMGSVFNTPGDEAIAEGAAPNLSQASEELARRFAYHAAETGLDGVVLSDGLWVCEGDGYGQHALRAMTAKWIRDESVAVFEGVRTGEEEGRFRTLSVNLVAGAEHADGYLSLVATDPATGQIDYAEGLYVSLSGGDREILGLPPLPRDYRFLPKVVFSQSDELVPLSSHFADLGFSFDPGPPPRGVEAGVLRLWLMQHLWESGAKVVAQGLRSEPSEQARVVVRERPAAHSDRPGVTMMEVSAVETASGQLRALAPAALVREKETEDFLRKRAAEYLALEDTGNVNRALAICRWIDEGQRLTLVNTTKHRHETRREQTREHQNRVGAIRVMEDCAAAYIETVYRDGGRGGSVLRLVRDQGEWKVWPFSAPRLPVHRFSPEQVQRLLELQEWGWEKQGVPEETRERFREGS